MHQPRPHYLDLLAIRLPLPGIISFAHRISGALLILAIPFALYALQTLLHSEHGHAEVTQWLSQPLIQLSLSLIIWSLFHHLFAGIRFLLIDIELGVERHSARQSAYLVLAASLISTAVLLAPLWSQ